MKVAVVGSRNLTINNLGDYLPKDTTEIVSGGARGIDRCARAYAKSHNIKLTEFLPEYERYGRSAPLKRNLQIIRYADMVLAFWDGKSQGTRFVIENCKKENVPIKVFTTV
ncbi:MAG: SLOG family protein [Ruminococcus sp.]|nr:SLOG family protein [Ruminococcus sp.]